MKRLPLPDQETLLRLFAYDPETGDLHWRVRTPDMFEDTATRSAEHNCRIWNAKTAGRRIQRASHHGHLQMKIGGDEFYAHRVIWKMVTGQEPDHIDHINGRPDDNRMSNLRAASHSQNMRNRKVSKNNRSGRVGVFKAPGNKWDAQIVGHNGQERLGRFVCFGQACRVRAAAEKEHGYQVRARV